MEKVEKSRKIETTRRINSVQVYRSFAKVPRNELTARRIAGAGRIRSRRWASGGRRRAFCSIFKAQKHRFEMPVTDLCDRAYVDSREGLSTSLFLCAPSSRQRRRSVPASRRLSTRVAGTCRSPSRLYYLTRARGACKGFASATARLPSRGSRAVRRISGSAMDFKRTGYCYSGTEGSEFEV